MIYLTAGEVHHFIKDMDHLEIAVMLANNINLIIAGEHSPKHLLDIIKLEALKTEDKILKDDEFYHDEYFKGDKI